MKNIICFVCWLIPCLLSAQPYFSKSFYFENDNDGDSGLSIKRFEDGYLILCGRKDDLSVESAGLAKINENAAIDWVKTYYYGSPPSVPDPGGPDALVIVDGINYISTNTNNQKFIELLCVDDQGDTLWTRKYDCGLYGGINIGLIMTSDSNLLILSGQFINQQNNKNNIWLQKVDREGNVLWNNFFKPFIYHRPWGPVQELADGSFLVSYDVCLPGTSCAFSTGALTKFDQNGNEIWTRTYNQIEIAKAASAVPLDNGDIAYAWGRDTFIVNNPNLNESTAVYILDSLGYLKSRHVFESPAIKELSSLRKLSNGDILGVGGADVFPSLSVGGWLFRMSPSGELLWERTIIDTRFDQNDEDTGFFRDATEDEDGNIIAVGDIHADPPTYIDVWVVKIGGDGCYGTDCGNTDLYITNTETIVFDDKIMVQPNPAEDYLHIENKGSFVIDRIEILDVAGRILRQMSYVNNPIDLKGFDSGLYIAKLSDKKGRIVTKKFIKK